MPGDSQKVTFSIQPQLLVPQCYQAIIAVFLAGCYSPIGITNDMVPENEKAVFYLKDSSYVVSNSDAHPRIEGGYAVQCLLLLR